MIKNPESSIHRVSALILSRLKNHRFVIQANLGLFCLLLLTKVFFDPPAPLLAFIGLVFLSCSLPFLATATKGVPSFKRPLLKLILIWSVLTVFLLGIVYYIDRAGWLWFKLTGYNVTLAEDLSESVNLSLTEFVRQHRFFSIDVRNPSELVLRKGEYDIDQTIVVPPKSQLTIEPGTKLRFWGGRSLISYSPIVAKGTENEPIFFTAKYKWHKWGVVAVVGAGKSYFHYVTFKHGRQALVNQINLPGSLSVIGSEVEIINSRFIDSFGKDAVHVRQGKVFIQGNFFQNAYKDGLDLDGGSGVVTENIFINCNDEGIDLSEHANLEVFNNSIFDLKGGRLGAEHELEKIKSLNKFGNSSELKIIHYKQ